MTTAVPPLIGGVDLGGTGIKAAVATADGTVLADRCIPTNAHEGSDAVLDRIGELLTRIVQDVDGELDQIKAIGMGVPGLVDVQNGVTKFLPNFPNHWRDVPVAENLRSRFGCTVSVLNDARAATLGELNFGHGWGRSNIAMVFLSLGTGVGGGIVIDGRLRLGPHGSAGEIGHQTILPDGPRCGCGNRGCLESLASGPAIAAEGARLMQIGLAPKLHELVGGNSDAVTTKAMSIAAMDDVAVHEAIEKAADYIGIALSNVISTIHPDLVVIGGGVAGFGDVLLDKVRQTVRDRVRMFSPDQIEIVGSVLGDRTGVMGAIALGMTSVDSLSGDHSPSLLSIGQQPND